MYHVFHDPISVCASFDGARIAITSFQWGKKTYTDLHTNLVHRVRMGKTQLLYVSLNDCANYFKLLFNPETCEWWIEETSEI